MPYQFQLTQTGFRYGLADGDSPHAVPFGVLTECENYRWEKGGRLQKRYGVDLIASNVTSASRLMSRDNELCMVANIGATTSIYSHYATGSQWRAVGQIPEVGITWSRQQTAPSGVSSADTAVSSSGLAVHAWITGDPWGVGTSVHFSVRDLSSGAFLIAPTLLEQNGNPVATVDPACVRVLIYSNTAAIFFRRLGAPGPFEIRGYTVDLSTLSVSAGATLVTDLTSVVGGSGRNFDAAVHGDQFLIAYNAAGNNITLNTYDTALAFTASGISSEVAGCDICAVSSDGTNIFLAYVQGAAVPRPVRFSVFNSVLSETVAPVTIETPIGSGETWWLSVSTFNSTQAVVMYHVMTFTGAGNSGHRTDSLLVDTSGSVLTSTRRRQWNSVPVSKPFVMGGKVWAFLTDVAAPYTTSLVKNTTYLCEAETSTYTPSAAPNAFPSLRQIGTVGPLVGGLWTKYSSLPAAWTYGSSTYAAFPSLLEFPSLSQSNWNQASELAKLSTSTFPGDFWKGGLAGPDLNISGATLFCYDGGAVFDYGFQTGPWFVIATPSAVGGGMASGDYVYSGVLEYTSRGGLLHRSSTMPSVTVSVTGPTGRVDVQVSGHNLTSKGAYSALPNYGSTIWAPYRTTVNGSDLYRLAFPPAYNVSQVRIYSDTCEGGSFSDTNADSNIGAGAALSVRPLIYTTGGVLDDYAPPANITMFEYSNRIWVLSGDELTWWYSKSFQDDVGVAPGFHPDFRIVFTDKQIGGVAMDDKAVFFSEDGISYLVGLGPGPDGTGSDFQGPIKLQNDVGCSNARSIVSTPMGIMFLGAGKLLLLTRGLEVEWIGRAVADKLAAFPNVTSAVSVPDCNEVRFSCNDNAGTSGIVLVFNYVEKQWSTSKYNDGTTYGCAIASAIYHNGTYHFVTPEGRTYRETKAHRLDGATYVPGKLETAWISAAGPIVFHVCQWLELQGVSQSPHDLTIECGFDSDTDYPQVRTFSADSDVTVGPIEECRIYIGTRRKCSSIRFRITDAAPASGLNLGTGAGPYFETMGLSYANLPNLPEGDTMSSRRKG